MSFLRAILGLLLSAAAVSATEVPACPAGAAHGDGVRRVAYAPAGPWLVSADKQTLKTWNTATGARIAVATVADEIKDAKVSPREPRVAVLTGTYTIEIRTLPELRVERSWPALDYTSDLAFSPDGALVAIAAFEGIRLWNVATGELVRHIELKEAFKAPAFSPDGKWLATTGHRDLGLSGPLLSLFQLGDGTRVKEIQTPYDSGAVFTVAFTSDSRHLVAGSNNDELSVWQVPGGEQVAIRAGRGFALWTVSAGTDAGTVFSAARGRLRVWEVPAATERVAWDAHPNQINAIAPSPDGASLATGGDDRTIRIWGLADQSLVRCLVDAAPTTAAAKATAPAAGTPARGTGAKGGVRVAGRLLDPAGKPVAGLTLKLPLAVAGERGGLLYLFGPHFFEATSDALGRFAFDGVKAGETYALVNMAGGRPSPMKKSDGSTVLVKVGPTPARIDVGDITVER